MYKDYWDLYFNEKNEHEMARRLIIKKFTTFTSRNNVFTFNIFNTIYRQDARMLLVN